MHTRRVAAFLIGSWLFGAFLMWFVTGQIEKSTDRLLASSLPQVEGPLSSLSAGPARQILSLQTARLNRHLIEIWVVVQLGLGGALIAAATLTAYRNRAVIAAAAVMTALAGVAAFVIVPQISSLTLLQEVRASTSAERDSLRSLEIWQHTLELLKVIVGLALAGRLLLDRAAWHLTGGEPDRRRSRIAPAGARRSGG